MTKVYFVRHAQPLHAWEDDRTRPLTEEGKKDAKIVLEFLENKKIDAFYCSPYLRSMDTISEAAEFFGKEILTYEGLRERKKGINGNNAGMFQKRWEDHNYHEEGGESILMVQKRNMEVLNKILCDNVGKEVVVEKLTIDFYDMRIVTEKISQRTDNSVVSFCNLDNPASDQIEIHCGHLNIMCLKIYH